jgi:hypothetical protein
MTEPLTSVVQTFNAATAPSLSPCVDTKVVTVFREFNEYPARGRLACPLTVTLNDAH